ncbi:hypothetical protein D3C78_816690 [compost metagenome]
MWIEPGDLFDADQRFVAGLVRQPGRAGDIADGVDARLAGGAVAVGDDMGLLHLDRSAFQPKVLDIADDTGGAEDHVDFHGRIAGTLQFNLPATGHTAMRLQPATGVQDDAVLAQRVGDMGGNLRVLHRQDALGHFHHADFAAQRTVETGELDADGAGTNDQQAPGQGRGLQGFTVRPDAGTIRFESRQLPCPRTGGEDDVRSRQHQ